MAIVRANAQLRSIVAAKPWYCMQSHTEVLDGFSVSGGMDVWMEIVSDISRHAVVDPNCLSSYLFSLMLRLYSFDEALLLSAKLRTKRTFIPGQVKWLIFVVRQFGGLYMH
eukprot:TRINITY_DN29181_c0_g1_i1.p1 TRINITY_DN29181_c0_g1~~TRINITY_DN29181_c0_g1_i1.p1  ORF type:complete len:124 (+),score=14.93 TRINITY_DN29181_c0_g1_i1:41-373(+)